MLMRPNLDSLIDGLPEPGLEQEILICAITALTEIIQLVIYISK